MRSFSNKNSPLYLRSGVEVANIGDNIRCANEIIEKGTWMTNRDNNSDPNEDDDDDG